MQAIADGWKWLHDTLTGIATARSAQGHRRFDDEVKDFISTEYLGQNLSGRLDASVRQGRLAVQRGGVSAGDISELLEEFDDDFNS